jgi:hypothetical protein
VGDLALVDALTGGIEHPNAAEGDTDRFVESQSDLGRRPGQDCGIARAAALENRMCGGRRCQQNQEQDGQTAREQQTDASVKRLRHGN